MRDLHLPGGPRADGAQRQHHGRAAEPDGGTRVRVAAAGDRGGVQRAVGHVRWVVGVGGSNCMLVCAEVVIWVIGGLAGGSNCIFPVLMWQVVCRCGDV